MILIMTGIFACHGATALEPQVYSVRSGAGVEIGVDPGVHDACPTPRAQSTMLEYPKGPLTSTVNANDWAFFFLGFKCIQSEVLLDTSSSEIMRLNVTCIKTHPV